MLLKKTPHVRQIVIQMDAYKMLICSAIGWTEQDYETFRFNTAMQFIDDMISGIHPEDKKLITYSALFWGWFRNKWHENDLMHYNLEYFISAKSYQNSQILNFLNNGILHQSFYNHFENIINEGEKALLDEHNKRQNEGR